MSLDNYRSLHAADENAARHYLSENFNALFAEAVDEFALFGRVAVGVAVVVVGGASTLWFRLRHRLPWRWAWLLPLLGLTAYAALKSSVVIELIRLAPEMPQMWPLYFKPTTPLRMVRTPVSGLVALGILMWAVAYWCPLKEKRTRP